MSKATEQETLTTGSQAPLITIKTSNESEWPGVEELSRLVDPKNISELARLGGVETIAKTLGIDLLQGISSGEKEAELRTFYGPNVLPHPAPPTFLWFIKEAVKDRTLIFLTIAAIVSLGIGVYKDIKEGTQSHWIEGAAIMIAVVIVVLVNAVNDWQKDRQFRKLSAKNEDRQVRVIRNGSKCQISVYDLFVGDLVLLDPGVFSRIKLCT